MRTIVIGLGNPILTDDSVGVKAARELALRLDGRLDVEVREIYNGGLALMESLVGFGRAVIVDAMLTGSCAPGTVREVDITALDHTKNLASTHDTGLYEALEAGRMVGLDLPLEVRLVGIEVSDIENFSDELTPEVRQALPEVFDMVMGILDGNVVCER